ncbi:heat stress transcription factor B-4-like [Primulina huaijiensis]|uniref:heat stress transcription factor B-4-like n=1 Tax=Primulina huaijiensis TaxID=1492673 RepID=UPI003CC6FBDD
MALMLDNCEGILLTLDSHKSVPAPFLTKTYQLVDDPSTDHIVSWGEDDATFVVWRPPEFARDLLPNYFKHNNFSSFVRQLNTYGFRKIVPDRWEFANEYFKKGEKHLLCEIHRRKTAQPPQVSFNHHPSLSHHSTINGQSFFPYSSRDSISPPDSDEQQPNTWCDSPPVAFPNGSGSAWTNLATCGGNALYNNGSSSFIALSEDNERLRKNNTMLVSELSHMRKLYNDIIYFVQNHVKPVAPSSSYHSSFFPNNSAKSSSATNPFNGGCSSMLQKPLNQLIGYSQMASNPHQGNAYLGSININSSSPPTRISQTSVTILDENEHNRTKLFGVPLHSKKILHPEYSSTMETNKARLVLEKDDLGLNLMPPC